MADDNQDLYRFRAEVLQLGATIERNDWITFPALYEACPWGNFYFVTHRKKPAIPPPDEHGAKAAMSNLRDFYLAWERLLQSSTAHTVKDGRELAVMLKSVDRSLRSVAFSAECELRDADNRMAFTPERCLAAVEAVRRGLARFTSDLSPQVLAMVAAVDVVIDGAAYQRLEADRGGQSLNTGLGAVAKTELNPTEMRALQALRESGAHLKAKDIVFRAEGSIAGLDSRYRTMLRQLVKKGLLTSPTGSGPGSTGYGLTAEGVRVVDEKLSGMS